MVWSSVSFSAESQCNGTPQRENMGASSESNPGTSTYFINVSARHDDARRQAAAAARSDGAMVLFTSTPMRRLEEDSEKQS